ncbi:hypothetical protein R3W88_033724 [Solanum pinnatisectum]|uniref:Aminotransferase-like plant mobile domain-containing protein n=1 Tax=Solanum pinnatisectum TaxID=50273 RepID=A0AAV9K0G3_9SOLN|nr:hypothetical protein R3W88_033724 [Solanum pinnatisectum]
MVDEREEWLVSPLGGIPRLTNAHFLNPISTSIEGSNLKPPSIPFPSESDWPLKVSFHGCNGWRDQQMKCKEWVEMMEAIHRPLWIAAGIYGALKNSIYRVQTDQNLIFGLVERWCCETNSFMFLWGEATISLEDVMILGGVFCFGELIGLKTNNHSRWLNFFIKTGREFVFPSKIGARVFSIAVNLARGIRLALAPVVLASIFRDLGSLRKAMIETGRNRDRIDIHKLSLWSPLFFVQVWERDQNYNIVSGVRIGRWPNVKQSGVINVRTTIDSSGEFFSVEAIHVGCGRLVDSQFEGKNVDTEMESFVRCLRATELVGFDCQEPYRPNWVAMQFGYDQDFPKWIPRSPSNSQLTWSNYSRPIDSDLRSKRKSKYLSNNGVETNRDVCGVLPDPPTECQVENYPEVPPSFSPNYCWKYDTKNYLNVPSVFSPRSKQKDVAEEIVHISIDYARDGNGSSSVFPPKCNMENDKENSSLEIGQTVAHNVVPPGSAENHAD